MVAGGLERAKTHLHPFYLRLRLQLGIFLSLRSTDSCRGTADAEFRDLGFD